MESGSSIFVAGHRGLVGSAILRKLQSDGYNNIILRTHSDVDLLRQSDVERFFSEAKPEYVFLAAAKVGGINANDTYPAEFLYENIMIQSNVIHAAFMNSAKKLLMLGSSCIYPRIVPQPIKEEYLLTSSLEKTNEAYAIAKIAGLKMCEYYNKQYGSCFISCMPTNLYGKGDNYNTENSHVIPSLIRKFAEAAEKQSESVTIWGTGTAQREFLHVDDMADACVFLMNNYNANEHINIGYGSDITIRELVEMVKDISGFGGSIVYDTSMPDGTPRKLLDSSKMLSMGWKPKISLHAGLKETYEDYLQNRVHYRK